jgi:hypothetical protein
VSPLADGPRGPDARGAQARQAAALLGPLWTKSSYSYANGNCVEVAGLPGGLIGIRDSRNAAGAVLAVAPRRWRAFLSELRDRHRAARPPAAMASTAWSASAGTP